MRARSTAVVLLAAALLAPAVAASDDGADAKKEIRAAFKPLKLPALGQLEKDLEPRLPDGIVIDSGPFDGMVRDLLAPLEEAVARREKAVASLGAEADAAAALAAGLKVLEKENEELAARVAAVEAAYGAVWDKEWTSASVKERRARQPGGARAPSHRPRARRPGGGAARAGAARAGAGDGERRTWLAVAATGDASPAVRAAAVAALGRLADPGDLETVRKVLRADRVARVRYEALAALGHWPRGDVADAVAGALGDEAWEVRSLAGAFCAAAGFADRAGPLVEALAKEKGRLRTDLDEDLHALFGVRFYGDAGMWRRWLADNADAVAAKSAAAAGARDRPLGPLDGWAGNPGGAGTKEGVAPEAEEGRNRTSSFYGIDTTSNRVLFVVDISRSMLDPSVARPPTATGGASRFASPEGGARIDVARWQLHRAVEALPEDAVFNLVVFSESYRSWKEGMTAASARNKAAAHAFIDALPPNGTTNIADSLDEAFDLAGAGPLAVPGAKDPPGLAVDTVFLLSDGNPNRGRLCDLGALLESVAARNLRARIVFHAVGIGEVAGSEFLRDLAGRTGGRYVGFK